MSTCKISTGIKSKIYRRGSPCSWAWRFVQSGKKGAEARRKTKYKKPSTILHRRPLHQWKMKHKWVETVFNLPCSMANSREQHVLCARCVPLVNLCVYTTDWLSSQCSINRGHLASTQPVFFYVWTPFPGNCMFFCFCEHYKAENPTMWENFW